MCCLRALRVRLVLSGCCRSTGCHKGLGRRQGPALVFCDWSLMPGDLELLPLWMSPGSRTLDSICSPALPPFQEWQWNWPAYSFLQHPSCPWRLEWFLGFFSDLRIFPKSPWCFIFIENFIFTSISKKWNSMDRIIKILPVGLSYSACIPLLSSMQTLSQVQQVLPAASCWGGSRNAVIKLKVLACPATLTGSIIWGDVQIKSFW